MDPVTASLIVAAIGSGLQGVGSMMGGQERESYGPQARNALTEAQENLRGGLDRIMAQMDQGIDLPEANFSLPTFSGVGLPMPIGLMNPGGSAAGGPGPTVAPRPSGPPDLGRPDYSEPFDPTTAPTWTYDPSAFYDEYGNYIPYEGYRGITRRNTRPAPTSAGDAAEAQAALAMLSGDQG